MDHVPLSVLVLAAMLQLLVLLIAVRALAVVFRNAGRAGSSDIVSVRALVGDARSE